VITKAVVVAVFLLAAAAAGDALRGVGAEKGSGRPAPRADPPLAPRLPRPRVPAFTAEGELVRKRVLRGGKSYLSAEAVSGAFPGKADGPLDVSKIAVAPDGTLVLAVYRFPSDRPAVGALELWRGRTLVGAFQVPPGFFGGGLAFSRDSRYVATFSHDGALMGVFDRRGRLVSGLSDSFLYAG
jgi:hypothetical protein